MRPEKAYQVIHQAMESFFKELPLKERLSPLFSKKVKLALVCAFNAHYKEAKAFDKSSIPSNQRTSTPTEGDVLLQIISKSCGSLEKSENQYFNAVEPNINITKTQPTQLSQLYHKMRTKTTKNALSGVLRKVVKCFSGINTVIHYQNT